MGTTKSWGHTLRRLTEAEVGQVGTRTCAAGKCQGVAAYASTYRYVSGRAGRATFAQRALCEHHATRFAATHRITVIDGPAPSHALDRALRPDPR